jgi:hypothetical protein
MPCGCIFVHLLNKLCICLITVFVVCCQLQQQYLKGPLS